MFNRIISKGVTSLMAASMIMAVVPCLIGNSDVKAFETNEKTQENTTLGTSGITNPQRPDDTVLWSGSYVNFGKLDRIPLKFRVLSKDTTKYGARTLLLDSDCVLYNCRFDSDKLPNSQAAYANEWQYSDIRADLNGSGFLNKDGVFTEAEKNAIAESEIASHPLVAGNVPGEVPQTIKDEYQNYVGLNKDKIFLLDAEDASNYLYGYSNNRYTSMSRFKYSYLGNSDPVNWYLRSAYTDSLGDKVGCVLPNGVIGANSVVNPDGVSPALNIRMDSILFSTKYFQDENSVNADYALTLIDKDMMIFTDGNNPIVTDGNGKYTVRYSLIGKDIEKSTQVSLLITDKKWNTDGAQILYYDKLLGFENATSISGSYESTFSIPAGITGKLGVDYHVYIFPELILGKNDSDYAGKPLEVFNTDLVFDLRNGPVGISENQFAYFLFVWDGLPRLDEDGKIYFDVNRDGKYDFVIEYTTDTAVLSKTDNCDLSGVLLYGPTDNKYIVILSDLNITAVSSGHGTVTASPKTAVYNDEITVTATPDAGYEIDKVTYTPAKAGAAAVDITKDMSFKMPDKDVTVNASFKPIIYDVLLDIVGEGTVTLTSNTASVGDKIYVTADPDDGYVLDKITYTPDGGAATDITEDKTFTMPIGNVSVNVVFKKLFTVAFDSNGGSAVATQNVVEGQTASKPNAPVKEGFIFDGWCKDEDLTQYYDFSEPVTENRVLHAKWISMLGVNCYDLSNKTDSAGGKYTVSGFFDDDPVCGTSFMTMMTIPEKHTLKAFPDDKNAFVGWYEGVVEPVYKDGKIYTQRIVPKDLTDSSTLLSKDIEFNVNVDKNTYVCAVFERCNKHDFGEDLVIKATTEKDGSIYHVCKICGDEAEISKISKADISLDGTSFEYTGKAIEPKVIVKTASGELSKDSYTAKYTDNVKVGTAKVTVTLKGDYYEGSKTLTFKIIAKTATPTPTAKPTAKPATATKVELTLSKITLSVVCGKSDALKATLKGSKDKITWKSSDSKVATVDASGKITAKMAGAVTITASAAGKNCECKVTVLYKDVTNSKDFWYAPTNYLTAKGVVKGYDKQTNFKPANDCTRAQMLTFMWRLQGEPAPKAKTCKFPDVKKTDYFYKPVIWAVENGITTGYKDGTFKPQNVCTRAQTVTFLWRMAKTPNPGTSKNPFSDVKTGDYFYKAVLWASDKKIVAGYTDGTFRPQGKCLRRQMVTFLYKYDKFINGKG